MSETQTISLPVGVVNKMLDIVQDQPYREVAGLMQEIGVWQASQVKPAVPNESDEEG